MISVKEESGKKKKKKTGLKLNIKTLKRSLEASGPISSWSIEGEKVEAVEGLFSWSPKSLPLGTAVIRIKEVSSLEGKL